ncbi:MAG: ATP-binding cassette domain-containing protein [Verrucomicrobiota bacterium]
MKTADEKTTSQPGMSEPFIQIEDLRKSFGRQEVLKGVNLEVKRGEILVVIGRSGEGKSVMLKHIMGLMDADSGVVRVDGEDITDLGERKLGRVRRKLGMLFQEGALFDSLNVARNVAFPLLEAGWKNTDEIFDQVRRTLAEVDLEEHMAKMPINLSGGMRKRVSLARAVVTHPECVLYDEPTSGLDPVVSDSIDRLIRKLRDVFNLTSLVVTHDMKSAYHIADRIAFYRQGTIYFLGTPDELNAQDDPVIRDFIEGRSRPHDVDL